MASYLAYLLDDNGNISREEIDAIDGNAVGWQLVAAHAADVPDPARGIEIWQERRLVFSSHPRLQREAGSRSKAR